MTNSEYLVNCRLSTISRLEKIIGDLKACDEVFGDRACVYASGSFGRLEAGDRSDLDLFIVVRETDEIENGERKRKSALKPVDEIKLKYNLVEVAEQNKIGKFDGGGKFLVAHTISSYTDKLGSQVDDSDNTLTGRMLLLLESRCIIGAPIYKELIDQVVSKYFRDFEGHEAEFIPAFLINDILRMWRTFCVNYEFQRKGQSREKIKNLKLKFSRISTCFSAIVYLLATFATRGTVRPEDVQDMVRLSPMERLERLSDARFADPYPFPDSVPTCVEKARTLYSEFLELTHQDDSKVFKQYEAEESMWRQKSYDFGNCFLEIIEQISTISRNGERLRRLILI